ncbi:MAG: cytochrome c oxidase subunit II, partial [Dehalococcoidia bacterium]|nr:cytochrome c oxidase subunit II [Dehalococcoidia bacterium]
MAVPCNLSRLLAALLLALVVTLVMGCNPQAAQSTFDVGGPVARMQLDLFKIVLGLAVLVFVLVEGVLLFVIIRFRRRARQGMPSQTHGNTRLEVAWTLAPALVLLVIAIPTVTTQFAVSNPPSAPDLEVRVVAHQWWWEFQYPDLGVVTANEMYIPVGKVVNLTLESQDVIHSFWVPNLAGKMDMIPNRINTMWLQADEVKTYQGQCAEFCG